MSPSLGKYLVFRGLQFNLQVGGGRGEELEYFGNKYFEYFEFS